MENPAPTRTLLSVSDVALARNEGLITGDEARNAIRQLFGYAGVALSDEPVKVAP